MAVLKARQTGLKPSPSAGYLCFLSPVSWFAKNQIACSGIALALLVFLYTFVPAARDTISKLYTLQHRKGDSGRYGHGWEDGFFTFFWIIIFTGIRAVVVEKMLTPLARSCGIDKQSKIDRFSEQGWLSLYYIVSLTIGTHIMSATPYWLSPSNLWDDWPAATITHQMKWYYLVQFGFWIQQIVVVNIEAPRKDYWHMMIHHGFTCSLLLFSYGFYQTPAGNMILVLMDGADIFLAYAKMFKYAGYKLIPDILFGIFTIYWFVTRHFFYNIVLWAIHSDWPVANPAGCYDTNTGQRLPSWSAPEEESLAFAPAGKSALSNLFHAFSDQTGPVCLTQTHRSVFLGLLLGLQVLTLMWFILIIKVVVRVLSGKGADDNRSDQEDLSDTEEGKMATSKELLREIKDGQNVGLAEAIATAGKTDQTGQTKGISAKAGDENAL